MFEYLNHKLLNHENCLPGYYRCWVCCVEVFKANEYKGFGDDIDKNSWLYNKIVFFADGWIENITCEEMQIKNLLE